MTSQPASSASIASAKAYWPGTEISARPGPLARTAAPVVRGAWVRDHWVPGACAGPPGSATGRVISAASTAASALDSAAWPVARIAMSRWLGPAPAGGRNPIPGSRLRFSSVAMAISAASTPSARRTSALMLIRATESA